MSDLKVEQKQTLTRQEVARFIAALAEGIGDDGRVKVRLGSSTLELSVAGQVACELEVAVDGDEIELELELKWSTSGRPSAERAQDGSEADVSGGDESKEDEAGEGEAEDDSDLDDVGGATSEDGAGNDAPDDEAAGSSAGESVPTTVKEKSARPRRGRGNATAPRTKQRR